MFDNLDMMVLELDINGLNIVNIHRWKNNYVGDAIMKPLIMKKQNKPL